MNDDRKTGLQLAEAMLGKDMADQMAGMLESDIALRPMVEHLVDDCYGKTWNRDVLTLRERSLITVAMMLAVNRRDELEIHIRGALANGAEQKELWEIAIQAVHYLGLPAAGTMAQAMTAVLKSEAD